VIPLDRVRAMLATATPSPIDVHRCDADGGDIDYQLQRGAGHGGTVLGYASDRDGSPRAKADATLWSHAPDLARDVLTLAAALETAERERDTARSAHAELAAAVRAEREALSAEWDAASEHHSEMWAETYYATKPPARAATARLTALLAAAPPRSTVDARVVREYLRAEANCAEGDRASGEAMLAARAAVEAALAGCV